MRGMDHPAVHDSHFAALMALHATKRRLAIMMGARKCHGEPTDDLEVELAFNRIEAKAYAAFLLTNSAAHDGSAFKALPVA